MAAQFSLLKTQRFLPLFVTQFFNAFNDNVFKNAMVIFITYKLSVNIAQEQTLIALSGGIFILPFFLFSATAGQLADKFEKAALIRTIKFAEIILMVIGSIGLYRDSIILLMVTLFCLGAHSTFFGPIKYAILPEHLNKNELIAGNGLLEAGTFMAILLGQILGGILIITPHGLYLIATGLLSFALLGLVSSFYIPKTIQAAPHLAISWNIFKVTWQIIDMMRNQREVYIAILGISWFWFIGATFLTQFPTLTKDTLGASAPIFTLFLITFSLGIGIGSLLCNNLLKGKIDAKYVPSSLFGMTVFMIDIYFATKVHAPPSDHLLSVKEFLHSVEDIRILIDVFLMTICSGLFVVPLYAILQNNVRESIRSRVIACNNIINAIFMVGSALFLMLFIPLGVPIAHIFLLVAGCNLIVALLFFFRKV